jgi:hypothetical protein
MMTVINDDQTIDNEKCITQVVLTLESLTLFLSSFCDPWTHTSNTLSVQVFQTNPAVRSMIKTNSYILTLHRFHYENIYNLVF